MFTKSTYLSILSTFVVLPVRPSFKSPSTNSAILHKALVTPEGDPDTETILSISRSLPLILTYLRRSERDDKFKTCFTDYDMIFILRISRPVPHMLILP